MDRQIDKQTDRQTDGQTDRQTDCWSYTKVHTLCYYLLSFLMTSIFVFQIYVCGFDVTEFSYVIEYLHTGCCHMTASSLPGLVSLAEYLELTDLQQACFDRLSDMISHDTVRWWTWCGVYQLVL